MARRERTRLKQGRSQAHRSWIDPDTLMRIKPLELRARIVVEGFQHGLHSSPYHGFSVEFSEYREYTPGDDLRAVDWRVFARSDRYYVKQFEDETNLRCHILLDRSRSMGYGSGSFTKDDYARTAAATLAYFLSLQRDAVGLLTFGERILDFLPARYRPGHLHRLLLTLEKELPGTTTDLKAPIERIARVVKRRGMIVLISDMLAPLETLETDLATLRSRGHEVILIRILDPREIDFRFESASMFRDLETGRDLYVDPDAARRDYLDRFERHEKTLRECCGRLGVDLLRFGTDRPLELGLFDFLATRVKRTLRRGPLVRKGVGASAEGSAS